MRALAFRTFVGSCATLISSVVNLTVLMAVGGEPGWMCLMLCNADSTPTNIQMITFVTSRTLYLLTTLPVLFCVLVLHWATKFDSGGRTTSASCSHPSHDPVASAPPMQLPEPVAHKRFGCFSSCEEDFPEGCWKAHPWAATQLPHAHACSASPSTSPSNEISPLKVVESEDGQMGIERALKLLIGPPRKTQRAAGKF